MEFNRNFFENVMDDLLVRIQDLAERFWEMKLEREKCTWRYCRKCRDLCHGMVSYYERVKEIVDIRESIIKTFSEDNPLEDDWVYFDENSDWAIHIEDLDGIGSYGLDGKWNFVDDDEDYDEEDDSDYEDDDEKNDTGDYKDVISMFPAVGPKKYKVVES